MHWLQALSYVVRVAEATVTYSMLVLRLSDSSFADRPMLNSWTEVKANS
jgi:hypothetical protein